MKFSCGQCHTGYQVPDDKVRGRRVKIACKRCGAPIVIIGPGASTSRPPVHTSLPPMRSTMKTQVGLSPVEAPASSMPPVPESDDLDDRWSVALERDAPTKMTAQRIVEAYSEGLMDADTLVWKKGMSEWRELARVPTLVAGLRARGIEVTERSPRPRSDEAAVDDGWTDSVSDALAPRPAPRFDDEDETTVLQPERARALFDRIPAMGSEPSPAPTPAIPRAAPVPRLTPAPAPTRTASEVSVRAFPMAEGDDDSSLSALKNSEGLAATTPPIDGPLGPRAQSNAPTEPPPTPRANALFFSDDEATAVIAPERADALLAREREASAPTNDRAVLPGLSDSKPPPGDEPTVIVANESAGRENGTSSGTPKPVSSKPRVHPMHVAIQNQPTRIIRVVRKKNQGSLWVWLAIVAAASAAAAGGFFASRFLAPETPAESGP